MNGTLRLMADFSSHRFGTGSPRVLFIHGLSSAGPVWWRIAEALSAVGHPSTAPDLRGHGGSPRFNEYTLNVIALLCEWASSVLQQHEKLAHLEERQLYDPLLLDDGAG